LHAGISAKGSEREKLEHLARYVSRPPLSSERLALTEGGQVRLTLKTPYRDGTTHVIFEPEDFIARLAALVPKLAGRGGTLTACMVAVVPDVRRYRIGSTLSRLR
jgi:hypothetical protein